MWGGEGGRKEKGEKGPDYVRREEEMVREHKETREEGRTEQGKWSTKKEDSQEKWEEHSRERARARA